MKYTLPFIFCLSSLVVFGQNQLSGLYWISTSGAIYHTQQTPPQQLLRGNTYLQVEEINGKATIKWGGFLNTTPDLILTGHIGNQRVAASVTDGTTSYHLTGEITPEGKIMGRLIQLRNDVENGGWTSFRIRAVKIKEDCLPVTTNKLEIKSINDKKVLLSDNKRLESFDDRKDAVETQKLLKQYDIDKVCLLTAPNPSLFFFTKNGNLPTGNIDGEDCIDLNLQELHLKNEMGRWSIADKKQTLLSCKTKTEAAVIIAKILYHKASSICYVNQLKGKVAYLKK